MQLKKKKNQFNLKKKLGNNINTKWVTISIAYLYKQSLFQIIKKINKYYIPLNNCALVGSGTVSAN